MASICILPFPLKLDDGFKDIHPCHGSKACPLTKTWPFNFWLVSVLSKTKLKNVKEIWRDKKDSESQQGDSSNWLDKFPRCWPFLQEMGELWRVHLVSVTYRYGQWFQNGEHRNQVHLAVSDRPWLWSLNHDHTGNRVVDLFTRFGTSIKVKEVFFTFLNLNHLINMLSFGLISFINTLLRILLALLG